VARILHVALKVY